MQRFVFLASPTAGALNTEDIAGSRVEVWSTDEDRDAAEAKARAYIMDHSWVVDKLELEERWSDDERPGPEKSRELLNLCQAAEVCGMAAIFFAWPKASKPGVYLHCPLSSHEAPGSLH